MNFDSGEARRRFAAARFAYLATADADGRPHIVPITFTVTGDRVLIAIDSKPKRSTDLKRLRNITENPSVAVLADQHGEDWSALWWVRGDGAAHILEDEQDRSAAIELLCARYEQYTADAPQGPVIEVIVNRWSGWAFTDDARLLA
jgi:PPOX class probable F420-dependent enzyme